MTDLEVLEDLESHLDQVGQVNPVDLRHSEKDECKCIISYRVKLSSTIDKKYSKAYFIGVYIMKLMQTKKYNSTAFQTRNIKQNTLFVTISAIYEVVFEIRIQM